MIIVLLKSAFLFFVLTSGRPLRVITFFVFSKPFCSHFAAQIVIPEFSAPLQKRCLSLSKGFPLQRETAKICYCCSQPFYSSFVALLEVILQRCSSAAEALLVSYGLFSTTYITALSFRAANLTLSSSPIFTSSQKLKKSATKGIEVLDAASLIKQFQSARRCSYIFTELAIPDFED